MPHAARRPTFRPMALSLATAAPLPGLAPIAWAQAAKDGKKIKTPVAVTALQGTSLTHKIVKNWMGQGTTGGYAFNSHNPPRMFGLRAPLSDLRAGSRHDETPLPGSAARAAPPPTCLQSRLPP